jgi:hypothetical protein
MLEETLVPIYLLHRFQLHAVGKLIGGVYYDYSVRDQRSPLNQPVAAARQQEAIDALLATLRADVLALPDELVRAIPPRPPGFPKSREAFSASTGKIFDPLAPARSATALTLEVLLNPERAARMNRQAAPDFNSLVNQLLAVSWFPDKASGSAGSALQLQTNMLLLDELMRLSVDSDADDSVRAVALSAVQRIYDNTEREASGNANTKAAQRLARFKIERLWDDPASVESLPSVVVPPGSPIGSMAN